MFADDFDFDADFKKLKTEEPIESPFATGQNAGNKKRETSSELGRPEGGDRESSSKGS